MPDSIMCLLCPLFSLPCVGIFNVNYNLFLNILSNPNEDGVTDDVKWIPFTKSFPNILKIDSDKPKNSTQLIESWLKKHEFWYETLTNEIFHECSEKYDKNRAKHGTIEDMLKHDLGYFNSTYNCNSKLALNWLSVISFTLFNLALCFSLF